MMRVGSSQRSACFFLQQLLEGSTSRVYLGACAPLMIIIVPLK